MLFAVPRVVRYQTWPFPPLPFSQMCGGAAESFRRKETKQRGEGPEGDLFSHSWEEEEGGCCCQPYEDGGLMWRQGLS